MFIKILKAVTSSPVYPENTDKSSKAKILNILLLNIAVIIIIFIFALIFVMPVKLLNIIFLSVLLILAVFSKIFLQKKMLTSASIIFIYGLWAISLMLVIMSGCLKSPLIIFFIPPIVMANVLLVRQSVIIIGVLTALSCIIMFILEKTGVNIYRFFPVPSASVLIDLIIILILIITPLIISQNELKSAEKKYNSSENKYKTLIETTETGYVRVDFEGKVVEANLRYARMTGNNDTKEIIGKSVLDWTADYEKEKNLKAVQQCIKDGFIKNLEIDYTDKDGRITPIELNASITEIQGTKQIITLCREISERRKTENALKKALDEKTVLLRELYHRTKNNMMVISAFLQLQKEFKTDKSFDASVDDTVLRINSMSLVHQKLYQSQNLSKIYLDEYIADLTGMIKKSFAKNRQDIVIEIKSEKIELSIDTAIPLGLVINEAITNSFKYAFTDGKSGLISIDIKNTDGGCIIIEIKDNGKGLNNLNEIKNAKSFGFMLINNIIEKQLGGKVEIINSNGLQYKLTIRNDVYKNIIR